QVGPQGPLRPVVLVALTHRHRGDHGLRHRQGEDDSHEHQQMKEQRANDDESRYPFRAPAKRLLNDQVSRLAADRTDSGRIYAVDISSSQSKPGHNVPPRVALSMVFWAGPKSVAIVRRLRFLLRVGPKRLAVLVVHWFRPTAWVRLEVIVVIIVIAS